MRTGQQSREQLTSQIDQFHASDKAHIGCRRHGMRQEDARPATGRVVPKQQRLASAEAHTAISGVITRRTDDRADSN
jgi:hypothetical protein